MSGPIAAYVDESGQPSQSGKSSRHFLMSAVLVRSSRLGEASTWLSEARRATNRQSHHELHWNRMAPGHRDTIARMLGQQTWGLFTSVIACKDHLDRADHLDDDGAYLYTLRYLIERVSWFGRRYGCPVDLTIAHKVRFKKGKLLDYDRRLRADQECRINWQYVDLARAELDQPKRLKYLQIADLVVSSTAAAFELDARGTVHPEYVYAYRNRLYRGQSAHNRVTSYGMKMHPWSNTTKAAYPWVAAL